MWLKNVKLEKSFRKKGDVVIGTDTEIVDLLIEDGIIKAIESPADRSKEHCHFLRNSCCRLGGCQESGKGNHNLNGRKKITGSFEYLL